MRAHIGLGDRHILIGVVNGDGGHRVVVDGSDRLGRGLVDGNVDIVDGEGRGGAVVAVGALFTVSHGTENKRKKNHTSLPKMRQTKILHCGMLGRWSRCQKISWCMTNRLKKTYGPARVELLLALGAAFPKIGAGGRVDWENSHGRHEGQ